MRKVPEVMGIRSAADYLGVSRPTLYRYLGTRRLPAFKLGGRWRIKKGVLDRWMEEESEKPKRRALGRSREAVRVGSIR